MKYQVFSDVEWLYPDTELTAPGTKAELYSARGADVCFQLLTDISVENGTAFSLETEGLGVPVKVYQLIPALVSKNSGPKTLTTDNYEEVKHFVTRKAPFTLYEITEEIENGMLSEGRAAFFIRLDVPSDADTGIHKGDITLHIGDASVSVPVSLKLYNAVVPKLADASFHMVNWIYYDILANQHSCKEYSEDYMKVLENYLDNQLDLRTDYLMLPTAEPIKDENGYIYDFDFSKVELVGNLALSKGFNCIMGGFVSHWHHWSEPELYLLWDKNVDVSSIEGYRQLKLYFTRAYECVLKNGWKDKYMQCLVDEPQFPSSASYRALSGICRQNLPAIKINDPIETTDICGALDVWVVKQAIYEKYIEDFQKIQSCGEEMWLYTCGFPAGATMNRVMDLPLTVSRLPMWMCFKYNCPGFLHWGYHYHPTTKIDGLIDGCCAPNPVSDPTRLYPAGNAHIVYPGNNAPIDSVRSHAQRTGAIDYELLNLLAKKDRDSALKLVDQLCRTFDDYDPSAEKFDTVRKQLLDKLG